MDAVNKYLTKGYVNSFLNTEGGTLIIGVEDDPCVVRSLIDDARGYLLLSDKDLDKIALVIDGKVRHMDPPVDSDLVRTRFVRIIPKRTDFVVPGRQRYVLEIHVARGREPVYFVDKYSTLAYTRGDSSKADMPLRLALCRIRAEERQSVGNWRLLCDADRFIDVIVGAKTAWTIKDGNWTCPSFVGREWLFARASHLLTMQRGVAICGQSSTGKTSFIRQLVCYTPVNRFAVPPIQCVAYHFCTGNESDDTFEQGFFVKNLIAQLICSQRRLKDVLSEDRELCRDLYSDRIQENPEKAFRKFMKALGRMSIDVSEKSLMVIAVDGFGSMEMGGEIEGLIAKSDPPSWLKWIITTRVQPLGFATIDLDSAPEAREDLVRYTSMQLQVAPNESVAAHANFERVARVCDRAKGSYVYVDCVVKSYLEGVLPIDSFESLPIGMSTDYFVYLFERNFPNFEQVRPVLALLAAAHALTVEQLAMSLWQLSPYATVPEILRSHLESLLKSIGPMVIKTDPDVYRLAHKRLKEWLTSPLSGRFQVTLTVAHALLASYLMRKASSVEYSINKIVSRGDLPKVVPLLRTCSEGVEAERLAAYTDANAVADLDLSMEDDHLLTAEETYKLAFHLDQTGIPCDELDPSIHVLFQNSSQNGAYQDRPLYKAARRGNVGALTILLSAKCDVMQSYGGWTALLVAAKKGHSKVCNALLDAGGMQLALRPMDGGSRHQVALFCAAERGHVAASGEIASFLMKASPYDIGLPTLIAALGSALFAAALGGFSQCVQRLLSLAEETLKEMTRDVLYWSAQQEERPFEKRSIVLICARRCDVECMEAVMRYEWNCREIVESAEELYERSLELDDAFDTLALRVLEHMNKKPEVHQKKALEMTTNAKIIDAVESWLTDEAVESEAPT
eukprot:GEMP01007854.1.p1 GENE.GEMP01007854.1~~GEMP01007854.1.p1  ORF type:complete len:907 (+),score=187.97 GEMP01007854.1:848-3568(+)